MTPGFEMRSTTAKGEGVFTTRLFKAGETVMVGVIEKRLSKNHSHASQLGEHEYALHAGLISKFNHSCNPNCGIRLNANGGHDFIAMRDIEPNEEATFDYAMRNYSIDYFPGRCTCGEEVCRGEITGWRDLPQERKDQYAGFVAPYLLEMDAKVYVPLSRTDSQTFHGHAPSRGTPESNVRQH